ncbi:hypothetical protein SBOR_2127 [Sclerotinia borealis F-4128]|uniref:Uncharacterized protein n=1 Tax=Sclerotinia borealis (strain F-4128) TaxID=1432307 RepID=W9CN35_SCLBF|nr:hypothetical protein SBOR_2127 [Sclerotinia borealis F-4128]
MGPPVNFERCHWPEPGLYTTRRLALGGSTIRVGVELCGINFGGTMLGEEGKKKEEGVGGVEIKEGNGRLGLLVDNKRFARKDEIDAKTDLIKAPKRFEYSNATDISTLRFRLTISSFLYSKMALSRGSMGFFLGGLQQPKLFQNLNR